MINELTAALAIAALLQPTQQRKAAAGVFAGAVFVHDLVFGRAGGLWYYGSAALFDLAVIWALSQLADLQLVVRIQELCLASIALNAAGWTIWLAYLPPTLYNAAFILLYIAALIEIARPGGRRSGNTRNYRRNFLVRTAPR